MWCMDSLRWDSFIFADASNLKGFTDFKRVHTRAGVTPPSLFATFMNLSWYQSNGAVPVPWMKRWVWLTKEFSEAGYHCKFLTGNPMLKLYASTFNRWFDEYEMLSGGYQADVMVDQTIKLFEEEEKPKFVFLLFMETHQPYPYERGLPEEYNSTHYRPITRQIKAVESLDGEFGRLLDAVEGTNTDILVFSDHGDLDLKIEGHQGHGPAIFHEKLFEIPLGRKTV